MTISSETRKAGPFTGNDVTVAFPFAFKVFSATDVLVVKAATATEVETTLAYVVDYTVALNADQDSDPGGTVTLPAALATGYTLTITSAVPLTQPTDLTNQGGFYPDVVDRALDRLTVQVQQVAEETSRAVKVQISSSTDPDALVAQLVADAASAETAAGTASAAASTATAAAATIAGFENKGGWLTATAYAKNNLVQDGGNTYICLVAHTSGTLATDIGAGKWVMFAQKGTAGAGSGDVVAANNLSEYSSTASTARANLGLGTAATKATGTGTGDVPLNSDIHGKHTIWVPAAAMTPRTTAGAASGTVELATNKVMLKTLDFDYAAQDEFAQFAVRMPKSWNEGTVTAIFVWSHASGATAYSVVWGIQGRAFSDTDALDAAFGTAVTVTDTGGTADTAYHSSETGAVTIGGTPAAGDLVLFQVYRDYDHASDTLDKDARLHGVALFYTVDAHNDA